MTEGEQSEVINAEEQLNRFSEFIELEYRSDLLNAIRQGKRSLSVDFAKLSAFDPELAEELLRNPEETIKVAENAVYEVDVPGAVENFRVRVYNLPETQKIMIRNVRSAHIGRFLVIEGLVRQKSDVRPQMVSARFECPSCGNVLPVLQLETAFKEPSRCGCGRKGKFRMLGKELIDAQGIVLEEPSETVEGSAQTKRMNVFLKDDLVSPISERRTNPGSKIRATGIVKEVQVLQHGTRTTRFDLLFEANHVEPMEEDYQDIQIDDEEVAAIKELASDPRVYERLIDSLAPSIYGYKRVKESLLLQLMGGAQKKRGDGVASRGDIHILLVGDPGAGKSQMLKRISMIAPKGRYVSGKGVSGAGLTAAVVRDEFLGGWSLEAGALVLANNGVVAIDEMDKMSQEDRAAMHEAMEQQTVSISKANIQATLLANTTVLAAANPKFGRFDPYGIIADQIDLPPTLINRFDLIFPIKDLPDEARDEKMASHILKLHQNPDTEFEQVETELLKKYVAYARQNVFPKLTDEALMLIKEFYVRMRNKTGVADERTIRAIPISARQLEAIVRLSEASARVRLAESVEVQDAQRAIDLLTYCLLQVGLDRETGTIDIDRIATGISASQRGKIHQIQEIIAGLEANFGREIPVGDIMREVVAKGMKESEVDEALEKLKRHGEIYEPRRGFISRMG